MSAKPDPHDVLLAELRQQPLTELSGVLGASGMAGASSGDTDCPWILQFTFTAWRMVGGVVQNRELTIRKPVSEKELHASMGRFEPYEVIRIRARVAEQNSYAKPQALLDKIIGKDTDAPDLDKRALELQEPVTFEDERFGVFTLDRRIDWYEAVVPWGPVEIRLALSPSEAGDAKACLPTARAIWDSQPVWQERIADYIVAELLSLKNDSWLGEDETEFSAEAFKSRLTLNSVTVEADGNFEFWYDDGDLFWGHSIRVSGSLSNGPTSAGIEG
jgi:hypothetical protein